MLLIAYGAELAMESTVCLAVSACTWQWQLQSNIPWTCWLGGHVTHSSPALQAYRLLAEEMYTKGWDYPLHLGVTEVLICHVQLNLDTAL